jgi:hypothetical protein
VGWARPATGDFITKEKVKSRKPPMKRVKISV